VVRYCSKEERDRECGGEDRKCCAVLYEGMGLGVRLRG
jgi:hypothetical protein